MRIKNVKLTPLPSKHYETVVEVTVGQDWGDSIFKVSISGYGSNPSIRELENGEYPCDGMNHVESDVHLFLAEAIYSKLMFERMAQDEFDKDKCRGECGSG